MADATSNSDSKAQHTSVPDKPEDMKRYVPGDDRKDKMKKVSFKPSMGAIEKDQHYAMFFMNPMMKELEENVAKNTEILDKMQKQMEEERKAKRKAQQTEHIPEALKGSGQKLNDIMRNIEDLIQFVDTTEREARKEEVKKKEEAESKDMFQIQEEVQKIMAAHREEDAQNENNKEGEEGEDGEEDEEEEEESSSGEEEEEEENDGRRADLFLLDRHSQAALTAHSLSAYVSTLEEDHLKKFTSKITSDCQLWLSRLFRFTDSSVLYHEEPRDGLVRVCRLAMYQKYPKYATEGFEALYSRPPVIYISSAALPGLSNYICLQLGLPMSCICTVPSKLTKNANDKMDVAMLQKLIQDDVAAAKTPVLLVAFAGTPNLGHVDSLQELQTICKANTMWLHVEGNNLATLALVSVPTSVESAKSGDSITISLGQWLGIPGLPYTTLFKSSDPGLVHAAGLNTFNPKLKLNCLPIWVCLQSLGHDGIVDRIKSSTSLAEKMNEELKKITTLKQIGHEVKKGDSQPKSIKELIFNVINALLVFEIISPTIVFKYAEDENTAAVEIAPYSIAVVPEDDIEKKKASQYYDALNTWLGETLMTNNPSVDITVVDVDREGICIRFSPLESARVKGTTLEDIEEFINSLKTQIDILDATVYQQERFKAIVEAQDNLQQIEVPNWAGLGVVQYIPDEYKDQIEAITEKGKQEINKINLELVHKLKSTDTAFSLGHTSDDLACVKFGLITEETDIEELIGLVCTLGKEIVESSKYLEALSEKIRKGIEEANQELEKESKEKLIQEGVLRQVPVVSSLLNWWSPPSKDAMKGRTFDLKSGSISSTEKTYKYHMQIQEDSGEKQEPKSPVPNDTSFKSVLKPVKVVPQSSAAVSANPDNLSSSNKNDSDNSQVDTNGAQPNQTPQDRAPSSDAASVTQAPDNTSQNPSSTPQTSESKPALDLK